jgi:hypothetical protein
MQLIPKKEMLKLDNWRTFEHYPKQGSTIMLHIKGYGIRENKLYHAFADIKNFDAKCFDQRYYTPTNSNVVWSYSWLPITSVLLK